MKVVDYFRRATAALSKFKHARWLRRIALWSVVYLVVQYSIIGTFFKDSTVVMSWLSVTFTLQTIFVYYFWGYFVLPKHLYKLQILPVLLWLFVTHVILYLSNYALISYLQEINSGSRVDRDWSLYQQAGVLGFMTLSGPSLYSFFYSTSFALPFLGALAVKDIIAYRTRSFKLEQDKLTLELNFLKAKINPHFLFNTLNSVYSRVFDTDEQAADLVLRLSELMRYNLYEADVSRIELGKELAYIENYLDLERNRLLGEDVLIDYEQQGEEPAPYAIAPLLLITFVENAFKHGVKGAPDPAYVLVRARIEQGVLHFEVENSVSAIRRVDLQSAGSRKKSGGIGLDNVRQRLNLLYADRHELKITAQANSYTAHLRIQLDQNLP